MPDVRSLIKRCLSLGVSLTMLDRLLLARQNSRLGRRFIRLINCHDTPQWSLENYRRQIRFYARHYTGVRPGDLARLLSEGRGSRDKAGLILTFDVVLRSNYDIAAPLLGEFGFFGWFFVPLQFIDTPPDQQVAFAAAHSVILRDAPPPDGRVAMTWDELRDLERRGHVIGCHTRTHHRLSADTPAHRLDDEIITAKGDLEGRLGHHVEHFCWVGGEERSYSREAAQRIRQAGYRYAYMTCSQPCVAGTDSLHLHRTNVESMWPMDAVRLQLCGIADWANSAKRRRVDALTAV